MKKIITGMITLSMLLCSCESSISDGVSANANDEVLSVVCTSFAYYDWTRNIADGSDINITYLLADGVDMHSFQPTASDMMKITECDLLVCGGGESEDWIDKINRDGPVLRLLDCGALEEEVVEGMQSEEEHEEESEETELDEHIWLSPQRALICCDEICEALGAADPRNTDIFNNNTAKYKEKLSALDSDYRSVASMPNKTIIVADRFPFRYLTNDYGLDYYAAFPGCSAECEASFETVTFLTEKCIETNTATLFKIDGSDGRLADTVAGGCTKTPAIAELDSMQSVSGDDINSGTDYISIMENDLAAIKTALS
ncbi:MAG: zinc ABC transporter substrate-binding protein [Oscillospiraceae bacterium]|nr:zinc ABC transporter substrate-binding protein [Oscillospiraceae bacterium]